MSTLSLDAADISGLTGLANVLIPGTADMPAVGNLKAFEQLLRSAVAACGYADDQLRAALDAIPDNADWAGAKALTAEKPERFQMVSVVVSDCNQLHAADTEC